MLTPRGVQTRDSLPSEDERAFTEGLGARRWEQGRGIARFTTRKPLGDPIETRGDYSSDSTRSDANAPLMSLSPPPEARADRSPIDTRSGGRQGRFHALPRER